MFHPEFEESASTEFEESASTESCGPHCPGPDYCAVRDSVKCIWNCLLDLRNDKRVRQGQRLVAEVEHHLATVAADQEAVREAELTVAEALETVKVVPLQTDEDGSGQAA
jgi:hypothetical protein